MPTVHAIRFYHSMMLLIAHKNTAVLFTPFVNRTKMIENLAKSFTIIFKVAPLYTEPFLMISGMLAAHSMFGALQRGSKIKILDEIFSRFLRFLPPLAFIIIFCTFVAPLLGSGPLFPLMVNYHAELCARSWWRNFLFIHNWFGFSEMCLWHTHHIGIDMELFWTAPFLVILVNKMKKRGIAIVVGLAAISTVMRYWVILKYELSKFIIFYFR